MVVTDTDLEYEDYAVAHSALTRGAVHDAAAQHERTGAEWPVSGDATVRAGTVVHRKRSRGPAAVYCGHGPLDACRCTLVQA